MCTAWVAPEKSYRSSSKISRVQIPSHQCAPMTEQVDAPTAQKAACPPPHAQQLNSAHTLTLSFFALLHQNFYYKSATAQRGVLAQRPPSPQPRSLERGTHTYIQVCIWVFLAGRLPELSVQRDSQADSNAQGTTILVSQPGCNSHKTARQGGKTTNPLTPANQTLPLPEEPRASGTVCTSARPTDCPA